MRTNPLRAVAFALLAAASLSVANAPAAAETFRLGVKTDALSLDPIATSDNASIWAQLLIYDQLVRPTEDGTELMPGLAESWEQSADGKADEEPLITEDPTSPRNRRISIVLLHEAPDPVRQ